MTPWVSPAVISAVPLVQTVQRAALPVLVHCLLDIDKLGVVEHHVKGGVPQQQPQGIQLHTVIQAVGGEVVAEAVAAAALSSPDIGE